MAVQQFAVGLGLTNRCNLACAHCYRDVHDLSELTLEDVRRLCESLPIRSVNLGTGENGLHPDYRETLRYLRDRDIRISITSNGYSIAIMSDEELRWFSEVEFSIDFPTLAEQDAFRGPGNWDTILAAVERCRRLDVEVTITAVMMTCNYDRLADIAELAGQFGSNFRVNVYQPVQNDVYALNYEQFWTGFRELFRRTRIISCGEPLVNAILGLNTVAGACCGRTTVRVTPRGDVKPCVYWPRRAGTLADLTALGARVVTLPEFAATQVVPDACRGCRYETTCRGGCASRRLLRGDLNRPDEYCPVVRGDDLALEHRLAAPKDLLKVGSACTTVVTTQE